MAHYDKYFPPMYGTGGNNWGRNEQLFEELSALEPDDTWAIPKDDRNRAAMYRTRKYFEAASGKKFAMHDTSRGYLFVRLE